MPENAPIPSPCRLICTLDVLAGLCTACGRTRDEIARWSVMSQEERSAVMARVDGFEGDASAPK